uniref:Transmembrane protein n=1 Tax=Euplotes crassus TaxID=5936 RepID=A0A7S3NWJ5_EUPCR|mmetsp:Transcript_27133/g.27021  ORF Transcript_27133/g.27021 Transcript_27133/m.27021 type:complete len:186 (+) Transcript_27133:16-573(+)
MQYQLIQPHQQEAQSIKSVNSFAWWVINSIVIFLNVLTQFYLHQVVILLATQGEPQFLVLHGIHIGFTIYNFWFTVLGNVPNNYFEGFMSLISFFISSYSIASMLVMGYWVMFWENQSHAQALAVVFITLFIVFPGLQSLTYRRYRKARNMDDPDTPEPEPELIPVYMPAGSFEPMKLQKSQIMI